MRTAIIEGYAALFDVRDIAGDTIRRGAFRNGPGPDRRFFPMLYQHRAEQPVGRWTIVREDGRGLFVKGEILLDHRQGEDVWTLLRGQALNGLSIGFSAARARRTKSGRELLGINLWEISIVTFPMAPGARVSRVGPATTPADRLRAASKILKEERV